MDEAMRNIHHLNPCIICDVRMAAPGGRVCTMCDVILPDIVIPETIPDTIEALT